MRFPTPEFPFHVPTLPSSLPNYVSDTTIVARGRLLHLSLSSTASTRILTSFWPASRTRLILLRPKIQLRIPQSRNSSEWSIHVVGSKLHLSRLTSRSRRLGHQQARCCSFVPLQCPLSQCSGSITSLAASASSDNIHDQPCSRWENKSDCLVKTVERWIQTQTSRLPSRPHQLR